MKSPLRMFLALALIPILFAVLHIAESSGLLDGKLRPAPDFSAENLIDPNVPVRLSEFTGRPVVLSFWASWCGACKKEFPVYERLAAETAATSGRVVTIATGDTGDAARALAASRSQAMTFALDATDDIARIYGVSGLPHTILVNPDGTIAARYARIMREEDLPMLVAHLKLAPLSVKDATN